MTEIQSTDRRVETLEKSDRSNENCFSIKLRCLKIKTPAFVLPGINDTVQFFGHTQIRTHFQLAQRPRTHHFVAP